MSTPSDIEQRILDCDTYHMSFDGFAREFRDTIAASLTTDGTTLDRIFDDIAEAQRLGLVREMYDNLGAKES